MGQADTSAWYYAEEHVNDLGADAVAALVDMRRYWVNPALAEQARTLMDLVAEDDKLPTALEL